MATIPSLSTVAVGTKLTDTLWNSDVKGAAEFRMDTRPIMSCWANVDQSIPNNTYTNVTWNIEDLDRDGQHSIFASTERVVIGNTLGWYEVGGVLCYDANATGARRARLQLNGTTPPIGSYVVQTFNAGTRNCSVKYGPWFVRSTTATDYITMQALQDSGGSLNILATFGSLIVKWLGS